MKKSKKHTDRWGNIIYRFKCRYFYPTSEYDLDYHRIGLPAIEFIKGNAWWSFCGKGHRLNGNPSGIGYDKEYDSVYDNIIYGKNIVLNTNKLVV